MHNLSPERLFSDPPLAGGVPSALKFSPDGQFVSYLRAAADDRERMDLWRVDLATGEHREWINATHIGESSTDVSALTDEERAERERRRQFNHGITQYSWHPNGRQLLIPMDGNAILVDVEAAQFESKQLCREGTRQSGFTLSPSGAQLSYVRSGNLFILDVDSGEETQLTDDASDTVTNGLPDFLAAEEMHRFTGHWWSPEDDYLAYCKVDDSTVTVSHRLEMQADSAQTVPQRYPYAGHANPIVSLWLYSLNRNEHRCIWQDCGVDASLAGSDNAYLARIHMDAERIIVQTQNRLQQQLSIQSSAYEQTAWQTIYVENSETWVNLSDDLRLLADGAMLISTEELGGRALLKVSASGEQLRLSCPSHLNQVLGIDGDTVFATGWHATPLENHLFKLSLSGEPFQQLTDKSGWHEVVISPDKDKYLLRYSDPQTPTQVFLCSVDGNAQQQQIFVEQIDDAHPYSAYLPNHAYPLFGEVTAEDGQSLYYRLTPPANIEGQHATIVYVYGGPGPQKAKREWTPLMVQLFAQNGFAVLELDNRGSGNRGRLFEAPIYRNMGCVEVADQVKGLAALQNVAWADLSRVGIYGHSYGGFMTLMCLSRASQHFKSGVAVAPVSDWHLYDTHYTERYMGLPADNSDGYLEANVLTHLHNLDAPLLLMHGMADDNVLFTNSTMIMARLQALSTPFELMTYPGAKHSMQERDVSIHRFNMILDFFDRTLNGKRVEGDSGA